MGTTASRTSANESRQRPGSLCVAVRRELTLKKKFQSQCSAKHDPLRQREIAQIQRAASPRDALQRQFVGLVVLA
jgi:hypothetical protein